MERLTEKAWRNLDPWECCGQDNYCKRGCHDEGGCYKGCIVPKIYDKLARYEDAEEQGRIIVLPCNVGDTIYRASREIDEVWDWEIVEIRILSGDYCEPISFVDDSGNEFFPSSIGKTVFLSREEAEKALEGMK